MVAITLLEVDKEKPTSLSKIIFPNWVEFLEKVNETEQSLNIRLTIYQLEDDIN